MWRVVDGDGVVRYGLARSERPCLEQTRSGAAFMIFDWAYQLQGGNPQLVVR